LAIAFGAGEATLAIKLIFAILLYFIISGAKLIKKLKLATLLQQKTIKVDKNINQAER